MMRDLFPTEDTMRWSGDADKREAFREQKRQGLQNISFPGGLSSEAAQM